MRYRVGLFFLVVTAVLSPNVSYAIPIQFAATLSGANENPANASTATGSTLVTLDTAVHTLRVQVTFSGLAAPASNAHIHCCIVPPGNVMVATQLPTFPGFPAATSGSYDNTFDTGLTSTYNPAFLNDPNFGGGTPLGAEAALAAGLFAGRAYLNIHDQPLFGGGEIRGFLARVPEPASLTLLVAGLLGLVAFRRGRHR